MDSKEGLPCLLKTFLAHVRNISRSHMCFSPCFEHTCLAVQGVIIDVYGVAFAANATQFTPSITQSDISSKACTCSAS